MSTKKKPNATHRSPTPTHVVANNDDDDLLNDLFSWTEGSSVRATASRSPTPQPDCVALSFSPERVNRAAEAKSGTPTPPLPSPAAQTALDISSTSDSSSHVAHYSCYSDNTDISGVSHASSSSSVTKPIASLNISTELHDRLYDYQREGVQWLYRKHCTARACLLADEMGLGKMVQVCAFLGLLYARRLARSCIVVAPTTLLPLWQSALQSWAGLTHPVVELVHSDSRAKRLTRWRKLGYDMPCILLTSYGVLRQDGAAITSSSSSAGAASTMIDYVILDEAHTIKSASTATFKAALELSTRHKIALTGTPVMNSFEDMWSIFRFLDGSILTLSRADFGRLNKTLLHGNERDASVAQRSAAQMELARLQRMIAPYMLRREKREVAAAAAVGVAKEDTVVWVRVSPEQRMLYCVFANSPEVRAVIDESSNRGRTARRNAIQCSNDKDDGTGRAGKRAGAVTNDSNGGDDDVHTNTLDGIDAVNASSDADEDWSEGAKGSIRDSKASKSTRRGTAKSSSMETASPLLLLTTLSQICVHPWLGLTETGFRTALAQPFALSCADVGDIFAGAKLTVCLALLAHSLNEGRKVLVFSKSRRVLSMLEPLLQQWKMSYCRLDGDCTAGESRVQLVHRFQTDDTVRVCLSTTQVGGVGLNLTAASAVVLMDPSWNPALDAQALDRVHRVGQTRDVCVYRLVTCGTVEEKMYRNQIFKILASKQTTTCAAAARVTATTTTATRAGTRTSPCEDGGSQTGSSCIMLPQQEEQRATMHSGTKDSNDDDDEVDEASLNGTGAKSEQMNRIKAPTSCTTTSQSAASHDHRYFTRLQLRNMFDVGDLDSSETACQLARLHPSHPVRPALATTLLSIHHVCDVSNQAGIYADDVHTTEQDECDKSVLDIDNSKQELVTDSVFDTCKNSSNADDDTVVLVANTTCSPLRTSPTPFHPTRPEYVSELITPCANSSHKRERSQELSWSRLHSPAVAQRATGNVGQGGNGRENVCSIYEDEEDAVPVKSACLFDAHAQLAPLPSLSRTSKEHSSQRRSIYFEDCLEGNISASEQ